jgi:hypothetical protein
MGYTARHHSVSRRAEAPAGCPVLDRAAHSHLFAGWAIPAGIAMRVIASRLKGDAATGPMEVLAAGFIGRRCPLRLLRLGDQDNAADRQMTPIGWSMP